MSKNGHFWSKLTPFTSKLSQLQEKCYEFFRNRPFLTKIIYFIRVKREVKREVLWVFCRKMAIFDLKWSLSQVNWVNLKRNVMSFFRNIPFLTTICRKIAIFDQNRLFLFKIDYFCSKLTIFDQNWPLSQVNWVNFKRSVMSFFEMEHFWPK